MPGLPGAAGAGRNRDQRERAGAGRGVARYVARSVRTVSTSAWDGSSGSGRYVLNLTSANRGGGTHSDNNRSELTTGVRSLNRTTMRPTLSQPQEWKPRVTMTRSP